MEVKTRLKKDALDQGTQDLITYVAIVCVCQN